MSDIKIKSALVTVSDTRTPKNDLSGVALAKCVVECGFEIVSQTIISDDKPAIIETLKDLSTKADLIFTTGGTGFASRDNTPEATRAVIEREADGLAEAMRRETSKITPTAILSRAVCGIRGKSLIINLPGSPKAVRECFDVIKDVLPHAVQLLRGTVSH